MVVDPRREGHVVDAGARQFAGHIRPVEPSALFGKCFPDGEVGHVAVGERCRCPLLGPANIRPGRLRCLEHSDLPAGQLALDDMLDGQPVGSHNEVRVRDVGADMERDGHVFQVFLRYVGLTGRDRDIMAALPEPTGQSQDEARPPIHLRDAHETERDGEWLRRGRDRIELVRLAWEHVAVERGHPGGADGVWLNGLADFAHDRGRRK